jgi:GAF domain-containing protein
VSYRDAYASAFAEYVSEPTEDALRRAYELGRDAVSGALSVLELASVHHEVLLSELSRVRGRAEVERVANAAAEFFLESLSAFEMVQRGFREAREAAVLEQRQTTLLRSLSAFLADTSLAVDAGESIEEMLQLVAEQTREVIGASCCVATAALGDGRTIEAVCQAPGNGGWRELEDACAHARCMLTAPLTGLDGRELGLIHLFDKEGGEFSKLDGELLLQLAQMGSAAIERVQLYAR